MHPAPKSLHSMCLSFIQIKIFAYVLHACAHIHSLILLSSLSFFSGSNLRTAIYFHRFWSSIGVTSAFLLHSLYDRFIQNCTNSLEKIPQLLRFQNFKSNFCYSEKHKTQLPVCCGLLSRSQRNNNKYIYILITIVLYQRA